MSASAYYALVHRLFAAQGNPTIAEGQMAYMRGQFSFFGLKAPVWKEQARQVFTTYPIPTGADLEAVIHLCFEDEHREMHYFALELTQRQLKHQPAGFIHCLETLVVTNSWWDTVDGVAKLVGLHFKKHPELILPVTARWMDSGNFWLQRVCLIFQLTYREKTNKGLLFGYIKRIAGSKEFFLQKGAGWALRQYSRTDPQAVIQFVKTHQLSPLTRREALRLLNNP